MCGTDKDCGSNASGAVGGLIVTVGLLIREGWGRETFRPPGKSVFPDGLNFIIAFLP